MKRCNKFFRGLLVGLLIAVLCIPAVACSPKGEQKYNPEERPISMALGTPDGVFNPFFSTSAIDGQVVTLTQVGMLNSDKDGKITYGDNEPTVVKDMTQTENGSGNNKTTTYELLIKNGIKFSDGTPLTIKDVLFNLYVYLDPVYTGSSTIYSTKIVGLDKYRFNEDRDEFSSDYTEQLESEYHAAAIDRRDDLIKAMRYVSNSYTKSDKPASLDDLAHRTNNSVTKTGQAVLDQAKEDMKYLSQEFLKELESDWNGIVLESYKEMNNPTKWMIFLHNDGMIREGLLQKNVDNTFVEIDGNRQFLNQTEQSIVDYKNQMTAWYQEKGEPLNDDGKAWAVNYVYRSYFPEFLNGKPDGIDVEYDLSTLNIDSLEMLLGAWASGETVYQQFFNEARSEAILNNANGIKSIEGITTQKVTSFNGKGLDGEHDVLQITIEDVDPKAIWNFAFTVAPMHYYSNSEYVNKFYWDPADPENDKTCFGFPKGDIKFFDNVINGSNKVKLPMGAGMYKAFSGSVGTAVTGDNFQSSGMINYERNEYFTTLGSGINNTKIKYFRYKVVESDQIINSLLNGDIDYGEPNATTENQAAVATKKDTISQVTIEPSGYGYVGINPRFIPDVTVRRAIIKAMNTQIILDNYYKGNLAEIIYRPMSKTSWAYPKTSTIYKNENLDLDYSYDNSGAKIKEMIEDAGYTLGNDGIYKRDIPGFGELKLEFKFTIAGGTNDHPAYAMFLNAVEVLNKRCGGWKVKVENSTTALSDMTTGKLTVWAAAWASTIDPDMYQVYHKDSQATSVKLWGYPQIKNNKNLYSYEWDIIQELSDYIDEGRSKLNEDDRIPSYHDALDLVMQLAVEMPTYQRKDMMAFNSTVIDESTLTPEADRTAYSGLTSRLWEVNYK